VIEQLTAITITEECLRLRKANAQLQDQLTMLDAEAAKDEVLLRQALDALNTTDGNDDGKQWYDTKTVNAAIIALKERLK
jgi:hypothetical protein